MQYLNDGLRHLAIDFVPMSEAAQVAESFFEGGPPVVDPWRLYRLGDFRSWPSLMTRLRAEFQ